MSVDSTEILASGLRISGHGDRNWLNRNVMLCNYVITIRYVTVIYRHSDVNYPPRSRRPRRPESPTKAFRPLAPLQTCHDSERARYGSGFLVARLASQQAPWCSGSWFCLTVAGTSPSIHRLVNATGRKTMKPGWHVVSASSRPLRGCFSERSDGKRGDQSVLAFLQVWLLDRFALLLALSETGQR